MNRYIGDVISTNKGKFKIIVYASSLYDYYVIYKNLESSLSLSYKIAKYWIDKNYE